MYRTYYSIDQLINYLARPYTYLSLPTYLSTYLSTYPPTCLPACIRTLRVIKAYIYISTCKHTYIHTHIHTYLLAYNYIYIYTYIKQHRTADRKCAKCSGMQCFRLKPSNHVHETEIHGMYDLRGSALLLNKVLLQCIYIFVCVYIFK